MARGRARSLRRASASAKHSNSSSATARCTTVAAAPYVGRWRRRRPRRGHRRSAGRARRRRDRRDGYGGRTWLHQHAQSLIHQHPARSAQSRRVKAGRHAASLRRGPLDGVADAPDARSHERADGAGHRCRSVLALAGGVFGACREKGRVAEHRIVHRCDDAAYSRNGTGRPACHQRRDGRDARTRP